MKEPRIQLTSIPAALMRRPYAPIRLNIYATMESKVAVATTDVTERKKCKPRQFSKKGNNAPKIRHAENKSSKLHHSNVPQKKIKQTFDEALNYDSHLISSAPRFPPSSKSASSFIMSPSVKRKIKETQKVNSACKNNSPKHPCPKIPDDTDEFEAETDELPFIPSAPTFPHGFQPKDPCILPPPAYEETEESLTASLKRSRTRFPSIDSDLDELPDITKPVKKRARTDSSSKSEVHPTFNNKPIPDDVLKFIEQNPDTNVTKIFRKRILKNLNC